MERAEFLPFGVGRVREVREVGGVRDVRKPRLDSGVPVDPLTRSGLEGHTVLRRIMDAQYEGLPLSPRNNQELPPRRGLGQSEVIGSQENAARGVLEHVAAFMLPDVKVLYEGKKLSIERTPEGKTLVKMPEPTLSNLVEAKRSIFEEDIDDPERAYDIRTLSQELKQTAYYMADGDIFSHEAVENLYNAADQLDKILIRETHVDHVSFSQIKLEADKLISSQDPQARKELQDRLYMKFFLGQPDDARFERKADGDWHVAGQEDLPGTFYERLFDRWQKGDGRDIIAAPLSTPEQIKESYTSWLTDTERENRILQIARPAIEESLSETGQLETRLPVLLGHWRSAILSSAPAEGLMRDVEAYKDSPIEEQLVNINNLFQPENSALIAKGLNYLPSEMLQLFRKNASAEDRNLAACIIADAYVKNVLQDQGLSVFSALKGSHMRLIVAKDGRAFYVDPNLAKEKGTGVEEIQGEEGEKILSELFVKKGENLDIKRGVRFRTDDGEMIASGNKAYTSGLESNMVAMAQRGEWKPEDMPKMSQEIQVAALHQAVRLYPDNAMAWLLLSKIATDGKNQEYLGNALALDKDIQTLAKESGNKIGDWTVAGVPAGDLQAILKVANADIKGQKDILEKLGETPNGDLRDLSASDLDELRRDIIQEMRKLPGTTTPDYAERMLKDVQTTLRDKLSNRDRDVTYFTLTASDKRRILQKGPMKWFEKFYESFAIRWEPGVGPSGTSYEAFTDKVREAVKFLTNQDYDPEKPRYLSGNDVNQENEDFVKFQERIVSAVVAASRLQSIPSGQASSQAFDEIRAQMQKVGAAGIEQIRGLDNGNVGYAATLLRKNLELVRLTLPGRWIMGEGIRDAIKLTENQILQQTLSGMGGYVKRYNDLIWDNSSQKGEMDPAKIPTVLASMKPEFRNYVLEELRTVIQSHVVIGRWTNLDTLDEAEVESKGLPPKDEHGKELGDFPGKKNLWGNLQDAFRYDKFDNPERLMLLGTGERSDNLRKRIGYHRHHIVRSSMLFMNPLKKENSISSTNKTHGFHWDPDAMTEQEFINASEAIFMYEYFTRSDRINDSTWRLKDKFRTYDNVLRSMGHEGYAKFGLFAKLRRETNKSDSQGAERLKTREELLSGDIATYMPEIALQQVYEINPDDEIFQRFFSSDNRVAFLSEIRADKAVTRSQNARADKAVLATNRARKQQVPPLPLLTPDEEMRLREASRRETDDDNKLRKKTAAISMTAKEAFGFFMEEIEPHLTLFRRTGYERKLNPYTDKVDQENGEYSPEQRDFSKLLPEEAAQLKKYYSAVPDIDKKIESLMQGMTGLMRDKAGPKSNNAIATRLAYDPRYLGMYYRTITDEDILDNIPMLHKEYLVWLSSQISGDDMARLIGDAKALSEGADIIIDDIFLGDYRKPEKVVEASIKASEKARDVRGAGGAAGRAITMLKMGGFYQEATRLGSSDKGRLASAAGNLLNYLGLDARFSVSLAKDIFGVSVPGHFDEAVRDLYENEILKLMHTTDIDEEEASRIDEMYRLFAHITKKRMRRRLWSKLALLLFSASVTQIYKESTKEVKL